MALADKEYVYISGNQLIHVPDGKTTDPLKATLGNINGTVQPGAVIAIFGNNSMVFEGTFIADSGAVYTVVNEEATPAKTQPGSQSVPAAKPLNSTSQPQIKKIKVLLDGQTLSFNQEPIIQNGSVLVPFRTILEKLGAVVGYDVNSHQIEAICASKGLAILFVAGNPNATIIYNGGKTETYKMNQPAVVLNNTTLVPIRFISETLGNKVAWDACQSNRHHHQLWPNFKQSTISRCFFAYRIK